MPSSFALSQDPIVAIATAPGRGAVGILRVSGRGLEALIEGLTGRVLAARQAHYVALRDARGEAIDRGLAIRFPAPQSYTGEDVLDLPSHGGPVVLQLLLAELPLKTAVKLAAEITGAPRNALYDLALTLKNPRLAE